MCFNKFDKCPVRILYIREVTRCFTHIEAITLMTLFAVDGKRKPFAFTEVFQFVHPVHIITKVNKTGVAPESALINIFTWNPGCTDKFKLTLSPVSYTHLRAHETRHDL